MKDFWGEFKKFALRGNVIDLAIGVVIGAAFGKIVSSLVTDIISPPLGLVTGGLDFSNLVITLREAGGDVSAITLNYGLFITTIIDFLIIAFAIFVVIKQINRLHVREEEKAKTSSARNVEIALLMEIRDLLKNK